MIPPPIDVEAEAETLRALAHSVRLTLLFALRGTERHVGEIEAVTGIGQPGLSQQLAVLRKAALVETRRANKQVFYRLNGARFSQVAALLTGLGVAGEAGATAAPHNAESGAAVFARIG